MEIFVYPLRWILNSSDVSDACFFNAANVYATNIVELSAQDSTEIKRLVDLAQYLLINGKPIHKLFKNAETPSNPDILKSLDVRRLSPFDTPSSSRNRSFR